ncbi:cobaltochelatase subunit CobN [Methanobacterium alcaliphilum]|uniref:cobaltochelatase subunit CobN n=1 Tax=Methanobacterium alcaliphilum TaxID=392018 RepID=UPI00200AFFFC|nr:cobaltochelatase subunit CobN [Methanobacterium alcaliphilum]MCK9151844.1 cobaltochelatase subunit CobN [Methanobacterium alcaliphilum]
MREKIIFILLIIMVLCLCGSVSAANINGTVKDAYNNSTGDYVSEYNQSVPVSNATVYLRNQTNYNQILYTMNTTTSGTYTFSNVKQGKYTLEIAYKTYKKYAVNLTVVADSITVNHTFVPDIAIISYYGTSGNGQANKMNILTNMSSRVYTIDSYNSNSNQNYRHWMLDYANFILIDMYTQDCVVSVDDIANSPANQNHMVAYVFGIYNTNFLKNVINSWNFLGGNSTNNTPNSLENTYIGSYWQAEAVIDNDTVKLNMANMLDYIYFLLGESSVNPTKTGKTPVLTSPSWGIYHPDYGIFGTSPTTEEINNWIISNPGYNSDGVGSLNWMTTEYKSWSAIHNSPGDIYNVFEGWYNSTKSSITGSFVVIASYYPGGALVDAMIKAYESTGRAVLNIFQKSTTPSMSQLLLGLTTGVNGSGPLSRGVVAVNSLYSWSMDYANMADGGAIDEFAQMNIEILRALNSISEYSYTSEYGPQAEWTYSVTFPQFEGVFGAIPVSYVDANGNEKPIAEGIAKVVQLTNGWANLKEKPNKDKKIAIILYNYPPGKSELGASYLDIFQSLHDLLEQLYDAGYDIGMGKNEIPTTTQLYTLVAEFGNKGSWAQGLLNSYVGNNSASLIANQQLINLTQYMKWFRELPSTLQNELVAKWGTGLGNIMTYNNSYLVIPGLVCGNVFITVQPSRGWEEVKNYHDATLPPHQQYLAFYRWLDEVFHADAMIHLGTHGTLEWLPGRSLGLQADDWTFQLSTIPNIYPYIVSNPGEGMVAKDRSFALVISHMTPATVSSGLYGNLTILQSYINNYETAVKVNSSAIAEEYKIKIQAMVKTLGFSELKQGQSFEDWLDDLHNNLNELENDIITLGLHSLGYVLQGDELIQETITISSSRTEILENIKKLLYPSISIDYYTMLHNSSYLGQVSAIKNNLTYYIGELVNGTSVDALALKIGITNSSALYNNLIFCENVISAIRSNLEWTSIMNALSGGYVIPGLSADPSYSDSLPTGTSIYAVDTTKMPTEASWESAKKIVDKILVDYFQEHNGAFPEIVALVMWGTELLRTEGIGIAEFLYLLGVKPTWSITGNGDVTGITLMDLSELTITLDNGKIIQRPRIDVFATAVTSNIYWLRLMNNAVYLVNNTNETGRQNYVKKHYAEHSSLDRIFGLEAGVLEGTGISDFLPNTAKWENSTCITTELAEIYLSRLSNAWTIDKDGNIMVSKNRATLEYLLASTNLITQNIDSTWRLLDSDDYYDWYGGLLLASQYLGANPDTAIIDIRNKNDIISRTLTEELEFEVRSMILNPKYQEALLKTPSGWLEYASKYENLFAFAVINKGTDGKSVVSDAIWDLLANNLLSSQFTVNADYKSVSFQSMAGWLLTAARKGMWKADSKMITELANRYIQATVEYGVACCHHTCANLAFNKWVVSVSSASSAMKKAYSNILQAATLGEAVYSESGSSTNPSQPSSSDSGSTDGKSGSSNSQSASSSIGESGSTTKSPSSSSSGTGGSNGESSSKSKSYEVTSGFSKNTSSEVSAVFILGVLFLIGLFGVGYYKKGRFGG